MAKIAVDRTLPGITALAFLLLFIGLLLYATIAEKKLGGLLYLLGLATIVLGFGTKEDTVAVGGVMGLSFLVILDIHKHVALLG